MGALGAILAVIVAAIAMVVGVFVLAQLQASVMGHGAGMLGRLSPALIAHELVNLI